MTKIRWITLLTLSVFLSGCGLLENLPIAHLDAKPTSTPIPLETEPPSLTILHGQVASPMNRGSFCWGTTEAGSICADVAVFPPTYTADMYTPVIGNTVDLFFDAPFPDTVTATLYPENNLTTHVPDSMVEVTLDENGKVLVTVPDGVNGNYALIIFATWTEEDMPHGDALYATPICFDA
ncbi:MAG: hypothetical protein JW966_03310 [Anaerolineae bacterium]|nr:hypothetical protein [Anaerolineae bacterium]